MRNRSAYGWLTILALPMALLVALGAEGGEVTVGKNPGEVQGRWLKVKDRGLLGQYSQVYIGDVSSEIHWAKEGKETPIDEDILNGKIREHLAENLNGSGLFKGVATMAPGKDAAGVLRLDCRLEVEPGSRAARYVVGFGAGKSKSVLEIHLKDHATGEELGIYHGYGTGSGMGFKVAGGGARKMTQDDIQENAKKFVELLREVR